MSTWDLPTSITIHGIEYRIRSDFRAVLDVLAAMNDPDLFMPDADEWEQQAVRMSVMTTIIYPDYELIPREDYQEACEKAIHFIDMGMREDNSRPSPRLMDWEQDAQIIIPAVNRVLGKEVRALEYMHWWTFMGAYMEIGDCLFSQIVSVRGKKARGKKLEKWEKEFARENKDLVELRTKYSREELEEQEKLNKMLNGEL